MKDLALTEQVKSLGRELGLDLVGVCSVNSLPRLENLDHTSIPFLGRVLPGLF
jgi:hypothetical protein